MNKILIALAAISLFTTSFAEESVQAPPTTARSVPEPYVPATSRGTQVGANLLYVTGGAVVTGAIAAAVIVSTNIDEHETVLTH